MIREIRSSDFEQVKDIWTKWYSYQMPFPDFLNKFIFGCVSLDDTGNIISVAGIRVIAEYIALTDKSKSPHSRVRSLKELTTAMKYVAAQEGFNNLNAFVSDMTFEKQVLKSGFKKESVLVMEL